MKHRIGIKYCGGCNPTYERVGMIEKVQTQLRDLFLFDRLGDEDIEALICVSGCQRACAHEGSNHVKSLRYSVAREGDCGALVDWLIALNRKSNSK